MDIGTRIMMQILAEQPSANHRRTSNGKFVKQYGLKTSKYPKDEHKPKTVLVASPPSRQQIRAATKPWKKRV